MGIYLLGLTVLWLLWMFTSYGLTLGTITLISMHIQFSFFGFLFYLFGFTQTSFVLFMFTICFHLLIELSSKFIHIKTFEREA